MAAGVWTEFLEEDDGEDRALRRRVTLIFASNRFGYVGSVGFDVKTGARMKLGLDTTCHYLLWKVSAARNFSAFTIGVHLPM